MLWFSGDRRNKVFCFHEGSWGPHRKRVETKKGEKEEKKRKGNQTNDQKNKQTKTKAEKSDLHMFTGSHNGIPGVELQQVRKWGLGMQLCWQRACLVS